MSDDRTVHEHPLAVDFDEIVAIDPPWQTRVAAAGRYDQTHLARCFVQIIDYLQSAQGPLLLWCHLASLGTTWDAPLEFRQRYWEEGDPPPPRSAEVPDCRLGPDPDPDEVLGITHAYAGQVSLLDACLGGLGEFLRDSPLASQTLLGLTSARGFPLGEHGRIGPCDEALYGELLHVPLLMQFPDNRGAAVRSQTLVEPADLWATLLDYWGLGDGLQSPSAASLLPSPGGEVTLHRDRLCAGGHAAERAIRTPAWHLRRTAVPELFAKPDDYWEANNVAPRCREVVECLEDALVEFEQTLQVGQTADLPPLSDVLLNGME